MNVDLDPFGTWKCVESTASCWSPPAPSSRRLCSVYGSEWDGTSVAMISTFFPRISADFCAKNIQRDPKKYWELYYCQNIKYLDISMSQYHLIFAHRISIEHKERAAARWKSARRQHSEAQRHKSKHLTDPANGTNLGRASEKNAARYMDHCQSIVDLLICRYQYIPVLQWRMNFMASNASPRGSSAKWSHRSALKRDPEATPRQCMRRSMGFLLFFEINFETLTIAFFEWCWRNGQSEDLAWFIELYSHCILVYFNRST